MSYSDKEIEYFKQLHDTFTKHDKDVWNFVRKYTFLDKLYKFSIDMFRGQEVERGIGNVNAKIAIVVDSLDNKGLMTFLRGMFIKMNKDLSIVYVTPFNKAKGDTDNLMAILNRELEGLSPEIVISLGVSGISNKLDVRLIDHTLTHDVVYTENPDIERKKELWNKIKVILPLLE